MFQRIRETSFQAEVETRLFIAGRYVDAAKSARFPDVEPAIERELAQVASASADDVNRAVEAAREAADRGPWPRMSAVARAGILDKMATGIEKRARDLGMLEARDVGKPVSECVNHDVARAARNIRFFAAVAQTWTHEAADSDAKFLGRDLKLMSVTQRPPVGVGAIVIPWNSPLMLATWNLGPCLAAGNTCVLKPSELAPLTSIALGEIANEAGLPLGVLNIVPGLGDTGVALVSHPGVDAIAFTGGVATGRRVMASAAESLKRVTLELGGKSPNLVSEEIFGPVLTVERFDDEEQAITSANATRFGLAAYVWTSNVDRALRVAEKIKTGMVWVNSFFLRDLRVPFGGAKMSGLGRQGGRFSMEFWTEPKLVCVAYGEEDHDG